MYDTIAIGELLIDFAPVSTDENGYPTMAANPGGAPPNFLAALAKYGAKTALYAKVGNDAFGNMLVKTVEEAGIETSGIVVDDKVFTTLAFVTLDSDGERSFSFARKPGADTCLCFDELDLTLLDDSKALHFGTLSLTNEPSKEATQKVVAYAKKAGKLITLDPNLRESLWDDLDNAREQILWGLSQADIVKISDNEVEFLWSCSVIEGAEKLINDFDIKLAMVTCGADGAYLINRNAMVFVPCPKVNPIDTAGAGDIFGGSAMSRIFKMAKPPEELAHDELMEIGEFAVKAASLSTQKVGGIPSIPNLSDII